MSISHLLFLDLRLDHAVLGRGRLLVGHQLLRVAQPAQKRLQSILEFPTMQQGLLQLGNPLGHLERKEGVRGVSGGDETRAGSEAYSGAASWDCDHDDSYPLVEGVPLEVGALQVVLQRLGVRVLGGTLNQALAHRVDVLQFGLDAVHLLPLHRLKTRGGLSITTCFLDSPIFILHNMKGLIKIITTTTLKVTIQKNKRTSTFKKTQ